jgi:hypothetical protein
VDEETQRYAKILKIKTDRLHKIEEQIAALGEYNAPPHLAMERDSLMDELGMFEIAIQSPARAQATDELGPAGRFLVTHQQYRDVKQTLAVLSVDLEKFIKASQEWRTMHRNWILLIGVVAILTFAIVVALGTAMYIGGLPK